MYISARFSLILFSVLVSEVRSLQNITLEITPEKAEVGQDVTMRCLYDLEGEGLRSLTWMHNFKKFYEYMPQKKEKITTFNVDGILIDICKSHETQITIQNVDFRQGGQYSCQVTAMTYKIQFAHNNLAVVSIPKGKPVLITEREDYEPEDVLRANCSIPSSKPKAVLKFTLNDHQVSSQFIEEKHNKVNQSIELLLPLQSLHFEDGEMNLRCSAEIVDVNNEISELTFQRAGAISSSHRLADLVIISLLLLQQFLG